MAAFSSSSISIQDLRLYLRRCVFAGLNPQPQHFIPTRTLHHTKNKIHTRDVDPFLLRALTELVLHKPRDARAALGRYATWRLEQRRRAQAEAAAAASTAAAVVPYAAAAGGLDYEGDARPAWLDGLEAVTEAEEEDASAYAALHVAPVLRELTLHLVVNEQPTGAAMEEGVSAFLSEGKKERDAVVMDDVTLLVLGVSGAGKSTLVAALQGEADAQASG